MQNVDVLILAFSTPFTPHAYPYFPWLLASQSVLAPKTTQNMMLSAPPGLPPPYSTAPCSPVLAPKSAQTMMLSAPPGLPPPDSTTPCSKEHGGRKARGGKKRRLHCAAQAGCLSCVERHNPWPRKYQLFQAAKGGCLQCVKRLVLEERVAADASTDTGGYSVLDFVKWGQEQGIKGRHAEIKSFLQEQLSRAHRHPARGAQGKPPRSLKGVKTEARRASLQEQLSSAHGHAAPGPQKKPPRSLTDIREHARRTGIQLPVQGPSEPPESCKAIDKAARRQGLRLPVQARVAMRIMESLGWEGKECLVKLVQGRWPRGSVGEDLGRYQ